MRVTVVSEFVPTPENRGGISALLYSLLFYRPKGIDIKLYSFNFNNIGSEEIKLIASKLNAEIVILPIPKQYKIRSDSKWYSRYNKYIRNKSLTPLLFGKDFLNVLEQDNSDFIFLYHGQMVYLAFLFPNKKFLYSPPDCLPFNRFRRLGNPYRLSKIKMMLDDFIMLYKANKSERNWGKSNLRVHFVGMGDYKFYKDVYGHDNAHFLLHPFVKYKEKDIDFSHKKLKVIIPGGYDMYYNTDIDKMLPALIANKEKLQETFEFTFLGKHWYPIDERLKAAGFKAEFKTWVEDYAEELVQHDIEITPISFGTGTKGKVLDAMVNGLLVVGSGYALENICVRDMDSCVRYRDASHIASILISVANHRDKYQRIAEKGRSQVMKYHDPTRISKRFFDIYYRELCGNK